MRYTRLTFMKSTSSSKRLTTVLSREYLRDSNLGTSWGKLFLFPFSVVTQTVVRSVITLSTAFAVKRSPFQAKSFKPPSEHATFAFVPSNSMPFLYSFLVSSFLVKYLDLALDNCNAVSRFAVDWFDACQVCWLNSHSCNGLSSFSLTTIFKHSVGCTRNLKAAVQKNAQKSQHFLWLYCW